MEKQTQEWTMNYSNDRSIISTDTKRSFAPAQRKKSILSTISIIAIIGLIIFELAAVLLLRERLGQTWNAQKEQQTLVRQLDKLRVGLRKPVENASAKRETTWVGNELNLLAGFYKTVQYDISNKDVSHIRFILNKMDNLATQYWNEKIYIMEEEPIDYTPSLLYLTKDIQSIKE